MAEYARTAIYECAGTGFPGAVTECGCCGSRFSPRRVRMWLAVGDMLHGEVCPECILRGPRGAAEKLRERIRDREEQQPGRGMGTASERWFEWMASRVRLLETLECFPLPARQAAVRETREKR